MKSLKNYPQDNDMIEIENVVFAFWEVKTVIESFYKEVAIDPVLKVPFQSVHDWPHHIERLTHFWWVRLGGSPYLQVSYNPPLKHLESGFNKDFLVRWLSLFDKILRSYLTSEQVESWMSIAQKMGLALDRKNEFLKRQHEVHVE